MLLVRKMRHESFLKVKVLSQFSCFQDHNLNLMKRLLIDTLQRANKKLKLSDYNQFGKYSFPYFILFYSYLHGLLRKNPLSPDSAHSYAEICFCKLSLVVSLWKQIEAIASDFHLILIVCIGAILCNCQTRQQVNTRHRRVWRAAESASRFT